MRKNYVADVERIERELANYEAAHGTIPGIVDSVFRRAFVEQIIDSEQRVKYTATLLARRLDPSSADPMSVAFDPLKAAILANTRGDYDEAVWLIFLFVHFGKHRRAGWRYIRDVYGRLGDGGRWDWAATSADPTLFRFWLDEHQEDLKVGPSAHGFGNHRKYESLNAWEPTGTGAAVESYVAWVLSGGGDHRELFTRIEGLTPEEGFEDLYRSMAQVTRFGRIARFDFLVMLSKLGLLNVRPPHSYLVGSTGPLAGARMLLESPGHSLSPRELQTAFAFLASELGESADVMEDAVCNWQKSPDAYVRFSG